ncbi:MAG: hypothetical protein OHK0039_11220 [Bacteroidia bacterium]
MNPETFITLRTFASQADALPLLQLLENNGIAYRLEDQGRQFDPFFAFNEVGARVLVQVRRRERKQAEELLLRIAELYFTGLPKRHFLLSFSDDELRDVLAQPDQWSQEDLVAARYLLRERGAGLTDREIDDLYRARIAAIRQPRKGDAAGLQLGWFTALALGPLGIITGYSYYQLQATDPEGDTYHVYDPGTRRAGRNMMLTGAATTLLAALLLLL